MISKPMKTCKITKKKSFGNERICKVFLSEKSTVERPMYLATLTSVRRIAMSVPLLFLDKTYIMAILKHLKFLQKIVLPSM